MRMVKSGECSLSKARTAIDTIQIKELIRRRRLLEDTGCETGAELEERYPILASEKFEQKWFLAVKQLVQMATRKTKEHLRSLEFPQGFISDVDKAKGLDAQRTQYLLVSHLVYHKININFHSKAPTKLPRSSISAKCAS
jgi:hypothetical protein